MASASELHESSRDVLAVIVLCPLLAMSDTIANAFGAAVAMTLVTLVATALGTLMPARLQDEMRFAAIALIVTAFVAAVTLFTQAWLPNLHDSLGVFLTLTITNVLLLVQSHGVLAERKHAWQSALRTCGLVGFAMLALGIARELVGRGSVFRDSGRLFGDWASGAYQQLFREDMGFLLAVLPPGAFISLGLLFAAANWWRKRHAT